MCSLRILNIMICVCCMCVVCCYMLCVIVSCLVIVLALLSCCCYVFVLPLRDHVSVCVVSLLYLCKVVCCVPVYAYVPQAAMRQHLLTRIYREIYIIPCVLRVYLLCMLYVGCVIVSVSVYGLFTCVCLNMCLLCVLVLMFYVYVSCYIDVWCICCVVLSMRFNVFPLLFNVCSCLCIPPLFYVLCFTTV